MDMHIILWPSITWIWTQPLGLPWDGWAEPTALAYSRPGTGLWGPLWTQPHNLPGQGEDEGHTWQCSGTQRRGSGIWGGLPITAFPMLGSTHSEPRELDRNCCRTSPCSHHSTWADHSARAQVPGLRRGWQWHRAAEISSRLGQDIWILGCQVAPTVTITAFCVMVHIQWIVIRWGENAQ